jgi:phosphocarrier protein HPr
MKVQTARVENPQGLHARSAATIVKLATLFQSSIELKNGIKVANARNIMALLLLEATNGTHLTVCTEGIDETQALAEMLSLIQNNFGETGTIPHEH